MKKTTTKTAKTNSVKTSKVAVKQSTEAPKTTKKVVYLASGVTGKMLQDAKIETNNEIKKENTSFSHCLKQVVKFDKGFTSKIAKFKETDCTPANLTPLLKPSEAKNGKFSSWLIMQLITRFYKK